MNKPDLHVIVGRIEAVRTDLSALDDAIEAAYQASLGEYDETTEDSVPGTASGDMPEVFEAAKAKVGDARAALQNVTVTMAEQQGLREFEAAGTLP